MNLKKDTYAKEEVIALLESEMKSFDEKLNKAIDAGVKKALSEKAKAESHRKFLDYKKSNKKCIITSSDFFKYLYDAGIPVAELSKLRDDDFKLIKQNEATEPKLVYRILRERN